ncbi:uncharacterized protein LOC108906686 isoform X2 [Anoplophora glabripennis]|uniref:uncharacterized protein LOC108906686 isoform X2 n=1 Tax=Anoplophora glabripennis TaxID=217634 RepID=UPI000874BAEA|nr:uncharacterized protein LOC108906686 isoform X2 [Anoplophora glabripennis]
MKMCMLIIKKFSRREVIDVIQDFIHGEGVWISSLETTVFPSSSTRMEECQRIFDIRTAPHRPDALEEFLQDIFEEVLPGTPMWAKGQRKSLKRSRRSMNTKSY